MDRLTSSRLAVEKSQASLRGPLKGHSALAASDAFFPFPDGPELLIEAGVTTIIHPGGSKRDQDTLDLCNQHNVTCLLSGLRHFRH
jgi:phosphoribosylaminoimidazolecarboxamide formyltransferase/IMP cyclohydrolase